MGCEEEYISASELVKHCRTKHVERFNIGNVGEEQPDEVRETDIRTIY